MQNRGNTYLDVIFNRKPNIGHEIGSIPNVEIGRFFNQLHKLIKHHTRKTLHDNECNQLIKKIWMEAMLNTANNQFHEMKDHFITCTVADAH